MFHALATCRRTSRSRTRLAILALIVALPIAVIGFLTTGEAADDPAMTSARVLVWADRADRETTLAEGNPRLIVHLDGPDLVEVDAGVAAAFIGGMTGDQAAERLADAEPWRGATYLVTGPADRLEPWPAGIEHLRRGPGEWWIVRGAPAAVEKLAGRGMNLVALDPETTVPERASLAPTSAPVTGGDAPHEIDPDVLELVLRMRTDEIRATVQRLQDFETRQSYTDSCAAAGDYLYERLQALGLLVQYDPFDLQGTEVRNIIATQLGAVRPDEIYIICGHYDSTSEFPEFSAPGADDNASGISAVIEAARVLSPQVFEATIMYMCFAGEEQGLYGGKHWVEDILVPQALDVRGVINLDMIGYVHHELMEWDANIFADRSISQQLGEHLTQCLADYTTCSQYLVLSEGPMWGSDHFHFAQHGYPAIFGIDAQLHTAPDWNPYYHTTQDLLETLDVYYLTEFARGAVACMAELAGLQTLSPVELVSFEVTSRDGVVTLVWETGFEQNSQGFNVLRSAAGTERFAAVNAAPIPARDPGGAHYEFIDRTVVPGETYSYRLQAIDRSGDTQTFESRTIIVARALPTRLALHPNQPNPFNPSTIISFELPAAEHVRLLIYDVGGRAVRTLVDGPLERDAYHVEWDGRDDAGQPLGSGVYFSRLEFGARVLSGKLVLAQ